MTHAKEGNSIRQKSDAETQGAYLSWGQLRPFKYCIVRKREEGDETYGKVTEKIIQDTFRQIAFEMRLKENPSYIYLFADKIKQFLSKISSFNGRVLPDDIIRSNIEDIIATFGLPPKVARKNKLGVPYSNYPSFDEFYIVIQKNHAKKP